MLADLTAPQQRWKLYSTMWVNQETVECFFGEPFGSGEALVLVEVRLDLPRTASEPAHREELVVLDVEGAALDADAEVERHRNEILREFYSAKSLGRA